MARSKVISLDQLTIVTQQLAFLLDAGVPLIQSMLVLSDCAPDQIREPLIGVISEVEAGCTLSAAMGKQPDSFPVVYRRSIVSAEKTGRLAGALGKLATELGYIVDTQRRVRSALTYPTAVVAVASLMVAFLLYVQVPSFLKLFVDSGQPVPSITRVLMVVANPKVGMIGLGLLVTSLWVGYRRWKTPEGRRVMTRFLYGLPFLDRVLMLRDCSQIASELSTLLSSGVDLLTSLHAVTDSQSGSPYQEAMAAVTLRVKDGEGLAESLDVQNLFPLLMISMLQVGEESGKLWDGLGWYAGMARDEMTEMIDTALQLVEPIVMGLLGLTVTFIALASFLPTYQLIMN